MNKTKVAALLSLLLSGVVAAQDPFYAITVIATSADRDSAKFGPWALSISADGDAASSIAVTSNWYSYFRMAPSTMDLAHRFRYENGCTSVLSSTTCEAYLNSNNTASKWFTDLSANTDQTYNIVTTGINTTPAPVPNPESSSVITRFSHDTSASSTTYVGYKSPTTGHVRNAFAVTVGDSHSLTTASSSTDTNAFASAYDIVAVEGTDYYLAVGTAGSKKSTAFNDCYSGSSIASNSTYCPGYETQASFWLIDSASLGSTPTTVKASNYINNTRSSYYPYTASGLSLAKVGTDYIAVGYSGTWGYTLNSTTSRPKNIATFWNLGTGSSLTAPTTTKIFSSDSDNPGTDSDYYYDNSWAVGINENGYIIGNRNYRLKESRNYPTKMFVAKYASGSTSIVSSNIISTDGVDSEGAAINNNDQVVGWTDERGTTTDTVISSVPRLQEAFLYNIKTGKRYAINDLICSSASSCSQNGYYYYIEYANDILDDGTILASARRFSNYTDWSTLTNGTNVVVKLTVPSTVIADVGTATGFDSNNDVPTKYVITNQLPAFDYGASSGGGSFGIFGLLAMASAALVGQYRRFVKKA